MWRSIALVAGCSALVGASPSVAQAPPGRINLQLSTRSVVFGESVTATGTLVTGAGDAGRVVGLTRKVVRTETRYREVQRASADANGSFSFTFIPDATAFYGSYTPDLTPRQSSFGLRVRVRPSIAVRISDRTPRRGGRVAFAGLVKPALDGTTVQIQRRRFGGLWATVGYTRLRATGAANSFYLRRLRIGRSAAYRVVVNATPGLEMGASSPRRITVRRG